MGNQIRAALIGFGGMGKIYAQMIYAGMAPGMMLAGVCCRNEEGQKLLKERFSGVAVYTDADHMAQHQEDYDAVIIVTPHTSHIPLGLRFAKLGKHILMDKPAGTDAGEVEELVRYCGCQFIIATHSPFLLAMEGARIYDLDASPVEVRNWWELDHVKTYFAFFEKHREHFLKK